MSFKDLPTLKRERGTFKSQLTLFEKFINTAVNVGQVDKDLFFSNLSLRLEKIEACFDAFNEVQLQIEVLSNEHDDIKKEFEYRENFENTYFQLVGKARIMLIDHAKAGSVEPVSHNQKSIIKLPTISLDKFDGCFTKWRSFNDSFTSMVDQNTSLSGVQKLSYLKASLTGEPKALVDPLETINDNYEVAWELLIKRYENKRRIINNHVQNILNIPNITRESHTSLRDLINVVGNNMQCLRALGQSIHAWDALVVPIIIGKLDNVTAKDWETKLANLNDNQLIPTLTEFLEFLNSKQTMLENISSRKSNELNLSKPPQGNKSVKSFAITNASTSCYNCDGNHNLQSCESFLKLDALERSNRVKKLGICLNCFHKGHFVSQCRSPLVCKKCRRKHHTLIHLDFKPQNELSSQVKLTPTIDDVSKSNSEFTSVVMNCISSSQVLLSTAQIKVFGTDGKEHSARVLLDSASQSNFITENLCKLLKLQLEPTNIDVVGINQDTTTLKYQVKLKFQSNTCNYSNILSCLIIPTISNSLPGRAVDSKLLNIPPNIKLADPTFYEPTSIDILMGASLFWELLSIGQIKAAGQPTLQKTKLGWIVSGELINPNHIVKQTSSYLSLSSLNKNVEKFWKLDEFDHPEILTNDEQYCENLFKETTTRAADGKFIVKIPFNANLKELGNSYEIAETRLERLERRLDRDQRLTLLYKEFINEYQDMGHMSKVYIKVDEKGFYLPHHPVFKEASTTTKMRVVFDGSCNLNSGCSINQAQHTGPTLQNELFAILIKFRCYKYVIVADIAKMYRQIWIHPEDRKYQRILWRDNSQHQIQVYELKTVTYGLTSAPYLAIRCLMQLAMENMNEYPLEAQIIKEDFYVDDILTGSNSMLELSIIRNNLIKILKSAGFDLRKWMSNSAQLLKDPNEDTEDIPIADSPQPTLGIYWNPTEDNFRYSVKNIKLTPQVTKRTILSITAQMYDPLGLLAPVLILAKFIIQNLWQLKLGWDEAIPSDLHTQWLQFKDNLQHINNIRIPRHILLTDAIKIDLHAFADASQRGYGTCIYLRSVDRNSKIQVNLIAAKSRVAPVKFVSLPRLELCAAVLSAQLAHKIKSNLRLNVNITTEYYWSDSKIVLCWLNSDKKLKTFVANRVSEIKTFTESSNWHHVKSADNAADLITRGVSPSNLINSDIWWHGPEWLSNKTESWPSECIDLNTVSIPDVQESRTTLVSQIGERFDLITRYSSLLKLKRVTALCLRFIHNCAPRSKKLKNDLSQEEIENAFVKLLKLAQSESFQTELGILSQTNLANNVKTKLSSLSPFLDEIGLIRVGGRLKYSDYDFNKKHPILLSSKHYLTKLIFLHEHKSLLHAPPGLLLSSLRERFWPILGRNLARQTVRECVTCFRFTAKPVNPIMGQLPKERVSIMPPFYHTGIDYAGPFSIKDRKGRGAKITKCYISLFICFSTKAIHLELVSDLTTNAFLIALRRFISRRGKPQIIFSDNGTNFVGAANELKHLGEFLLVNQNTLTREASNQNLSWQFIPPHSPNFGGLWEAGVKTVKYHFKRVFRNALLNYEEFSTVLIQIESVINSRPLTPMSSDPNDMSPLTPAHFLIGRPLTAIMDPNVMDIPLNRLSRFQYLQNLKQHFWTRWSREYVSELQQLTKWKQIQPELNHEALVLIKEDNRPPANWLLGRIVQRHPGKDNVTRVVSIMLPNGTITKRSVHKICALPVDNKPKSL